MLHKVDLLRRAGARQGKIQGWEGELRRDFNPARDQPPFGLLTSKGGGSTHFGTLGWGLQVAICHHEANAIVMNFALFSPFSQLNNSHYYCVGQAFCAQVASGHPLPPAQNR